MIKKYQPPNTVAIMLCDDSKLRMSYTNIAKVDQAKTLPIVLYRYGDTFSKIYVSVPVNGRTLIFNEKARILYFEEPSGSNEVITVESLNKVYAWLQGGL